MVKDGAHSLISMYEVTEYVSVFILFNGESAQY